MADPSDYTQMWSSVFTPPRVGDDDRGVYLLDDETSVGRSGKIYDECTRDDILRDDVARAGGQRRPGPDTTTCRASVRSGEGFRAGPGATEQALYTRGSRTLGHPGSRGMVTSSRADRRAIDDIAWDNRPPHFADDTPNEFAHLYIDPRARGPPLYSKNSTYPRFRQVDRFGGSPAPRDASAEMVKVVLLIIIAVLAAMCCLQQMVLGAEKRIGREVECALREAMLSRGAREAGGA